MNRVDGKVVLVTGAARGQGRSHAVRLAQEGANIIAFDLCADIASNEYPLASPADLEETARLVKEAGQQVVTARVDVRDRAGLETALAEAVGQLGGLHVVVANAGICPLGKHVSTAGFVDAFDVNFLGVVNTVHASMEYLGEGGSIIAIGSVAGLVPQTGFNGQQGAPGSGWRRIRPGQEADSGLHQFVGADPRPSSIRVNAIHPTNVNTDMLQSMPMYRTFRPDLENPTAEDAAVTFPFMQAMPTPWVEPADISHAVVYLSSDESRFVTGQQLRVDAGAGMKIGL